MFDFLKNIGATELIIIGVILIVFFGSKKIIELGKSSGETLKEVKKIKNEFSGAMEDVKEPEETKVKEEVREGVEE